MVLNMFHGTLQPLAGAARTLAQLAEDGLLPAAARRRRSRRDVPWVATLLTAGMSIVFLLIGDPTWMIAAANLTYLIGICLPSVAVWLLRRHSPELHRPYRAPRGTIVLGRGRGVRLGRERRPRASSSSGCRRSSSVSALAYSGAALYALRVLAGPPGGGLPRPAPLAAHQAHRRDAPGAAAGRRRIPDRGQRVDARDEPVVNPRSRTSSSPSRW